MPPPMGIDKGVVSLEPGVLLAYHTWMDAMPPLAPLDPGFLRVLRWRGAIQSAVLVGAAALAEVVLNRKGLPNGIVLAVAIAIGLWLTIVSPQRRFAHWGFAFDGRELHVAHGWLTRVHTVVPVGRVQHIDLRQSPVERGCGVATLVLHTAGTDHSRVAVPGLAHGHAEAVRDRIRAAIETSPW